MVQPLTARKRIRKSFGRIAEVTEMPNLIEVQRQSYEAFLQMHTKAPERTLLGLEEVFRSIFPIRDFADRAALDFVKYELEEPKYDVEECHQRGMTYAGTVAGDAAADRLGRRRGDRLAQSVRDIKEQDVYMGDMPLMTDNGTFVDQRHRARHRQPDAPQPRRLLRPRPRQDAQLGQVSVLVPGSSPTAARGSTSSSTPRISSTSASTGAGSCL